MSRWSPTVQPTTQFADNSALVNGITGASATLLRALEQRQERKIDAGRYADGQARIARGEARQAGLDKLSADATRLQMQDNQLGTLSKARGMGYVEGPTAGDRLAPMRGVGDAGLPGAAGMASGAASQLASALDAAPSDSMSVTGPLGNKALRYDPTQTRDARDESRMLAMLGKRQAFEVDQQKSGQEFQQGMQNDSQEFQGAQNAAGRAQAASLAGLARSRPEMVSTPQGIMMIDPRTGQATPVQMNGETVVGAGGRTASAQANEAALYGSQMSAATQTLSALEKAGVETNKPFGVMTQAGLNQAGSGFTGDVLSGLARKTLSGPEQQLDNAKNQFSTSAVYAFTGKTATAPEVGRLRSVFFTQSGEDPNAVGAQKAGAREVATLAMQARTQGRALDLVTTAKHLMGKGYKEPEIQAIMGALAPFMAQQQAGGQP